MDSREKEDLKNTRVSIEFDPEALDAGRLKLTVTLTGESDAWETMLAAAVNVIADKEYTEPETVLAITATALEQIHLKRKMDMAAFKKVLRNGRKYMQEE